MFFSRLAIPGPILGMMAVFCLLAPARLHAKAQTLHWYRMGEEDAPIAVDEAKTKSLHDSAGGADLSVIGTPVTYTKVWPVSTPSPYPISTRSAAAIFLLSGSQCQGDLLGTDTDDFGFEFSFVPVNGFVDCHLAANGVPGTNGWSFYVEGSFLYVTCGKFTIRAASISYFDLNHVALIKTGGVTSLYLNGSKITLNQEIATAPILPATGKFVLGESKAKICLDEVRYFKITPGTFTLEDVLGFSPRLWLQPTGIPNGGSIDSEEKSISIDMGSHGTGSATHENITIASYPFSNQWFPLKITSVQLSGPDAAEFEFPATTTTDHSDSDRVYGPIWFRPTSPGPKSATLTILSNDPVYGHYEVHLQGNAVPGSNLQVSTDPATAPRTNDGTPILLPLTSPNSISEEKIITLSNHGQADLHLSGISISGSDATSFIVSSQPSTSTLAPGSTITFGIRFSPSQAGECNARIMIVSDAADWPKFYIPVTAVAAGPVLQLTGPGNQRLSSRAVLAWGRTAPDNYATLAGLSESLSIAAGTKFVAALRKNGTVAVAGGGSGINYADNFSDIPDNVPAGLSGVIAISAGFGHVLALKSDGTVAAWGSDNYGQTDVPEGLDSVIAISAGPYHSSALRSDGSIIQWGSSSESPINAPATDDIVSISAGSQGTLALKTDGSLTLVGRPASVLPDGLGHLVSVSSGLPSVGLRSDGSTASWEASINHIDTPFSTTSSPIISVSAGNYIHAALHADGSVNLASTYPPSFGELTEPAGNRFVSTITTGDFQFAELYDSQVDFGTHQAGLAGTPQTFTITNGGSTTLDFGTVTLNGVNVGDFVLDDSGMPNSLPPGETTTLTVTFSPAATGISRATLQIPSNDPGHPSFTVRLVGKSYSGPYEGWKLGYFNTTDSTGDSADDADPNHNGIPNLLEYVLGGDPSGNMTGRSILPSFSQDGSAHFSISHDPSRTDAKTIVQGSDTLDDGSWVDLASSTDGADYQALAPGVECHTSADPDHPGLQRVEITEIRAASGQPHRFFRLQASRP